MENQKERYGQGSHKSKLLAAFENNPTNEIVMICGHYKIKKSTRNRAELLNHIRHEIIHPSPYPELGSNLPLYLEKLSKINVLWQPPMENYVHNILDYFCSHSLLKWAAEIVIEVGTEIIESDKEFRQLSDARTWLIEEIKKNAARSDISSATPSE